MLDIGWGEMLVIAIVVIVVVGPKELPGMLRTFGKTTSKLRVMANDFRKQFDDALKEAELDDLKKVADDVRALNPKNEIRKALAPMEQAAKDVRAGLDAAMQPKAEPSPDAAVASADAPAAPVEPAKTGPAPIPGAEAATAPVLAAAVPPVAAVAEKPAARAAKAPAAAKSKTAAAPRAKAAAASKPKAVAKPKARASKKTGGDVA